MEIDWLALALDFWKNLNIFLSASIVVKAIKFFLFVYVVVLFADVVMLLILRGVSGDIKKTLFGTTRPLISKSKSIIRWEKILARLGDANPSQYKVAVLEADAFAEEIVSGMGYTGETMADKLASVHPGQIENRERLIDAHQIRNRIIHEADFVMSREEAKSCLESYEAFFREMELF
ncbi:MAG: hypothetical protein PHH40_02300 [Candidatus Moranbacteria bacterium]|nr:hypothetical protein [Candidatus Moranbacteria bacterium]MDD3965386.1 hypothetical protein [Candidatus Moranbacteria bacterium]